ncbi:12608_t:CDS:1, partial [Entrophospora sp. SA101]
LENNLENKQSKKKQERQSINQLFENDTETAIKKLEKQVTEITK